MIEQLDNDQSRLHNRGGMCCVCVCVYLEGGCMCLNVGLLLCCEHLPPYDHTPAKSAIYPSHLCTTHGVYLCGITMTVCENMFDSTVCESQPLAEMKEGICGGAPCVCGLTCCVFDVEVP